MSEPKTTKAGRAVLKAISPLIEASGARCWIADPTGRGHQRLVISLNGQERFTPLSGTPRLVDQAIKHKIADVRKLLSGMTK